MHPSFRAQQGGAWNRHLGKSGKCLSWGLILLSSLVAPSVSRSDESPVIRKQIAAGEELFLRQWTVGDKRSVAGDGLGPMYNAASCIECHRLVSATCVLGTPAV